MKKKIIISISILIIGILSKLWTGIYVHDEFYDLHFFVKHRPIWKWYFYSPIGMSDKTLADLNEKNKQEQLLFNEFIKDKGLSK